MAGLSYMRSTYQNSRQLACLFRKPGFPPILAAMKNSWFHLFFGLLPFFSQTAEGPSIIDIMKINTGTLSGESRHGTGQCRLHVQPEPAGCDTSGNCHSSEYFVIVNLPGSGSTPDFKAAFGVSPNEGRWVVDSDLHQIALNMTARVDAYTDPLYLRFDPQTLQITRLYYGPSDLICDLKLSPETVPTPPDGHL